MAKISLIKFRGKPITVGCGRFSFPIENGEVVHNEASLNGSIFNNCEKQYFEALELATEAFRNNKYDEIVDN